MGIDPVRNGITTIRSELAEVDDPHWGSPPDWEIVRSKLKSLIESGHADAIIDLGDELLEAGTRAVELFDQEGEVAEEIAPCLTVVFQAIEQSDRSPAEKLRCAMDLEVEDEYSLCATGFQDFWHARRTKAECQALSTELQSLLERRQQRRGISKGEESGYQRERLGALLAEALRKAGRPQDATALLKREAIATGNYQRLVGHLLAQRRWEEAEDWCRRAIAATNDRRWEIDGWLEQLRKLRERMRDWTGVAALRAEEFFAHPSALSFRALLTATHKAGVRREVEAWARRFLINGTLPPKGARATSKGTRQQGLSWPLPDLKLPRSKPPQAPMVPALLEIALAEKKPDEIIRWYDHPVMRRRRSLLSDRLDHQVAQAVSRTYPDRAVKIWRRLAEREISTTKVSAYPIAARYLRGVKDTLVRAGRTNEWNSYLAQLLEKNRRKTKCVETLKLIVPPK